MPKKTKKQKIISEYRKRINAISSSNVHVSPVEHVPSSTPPSSTISLSTIASSPVTRAQETQSFVSVNEFAEIKKDLVMTLVITAIILIGEFGIAWYIRF